MTRRIEQTLNLPRLEDAVREFNQAAPELEEASRKVDKISASLDKVSRSERDEEGTEVHCKEMDEVYRQALKAHKDMIDLGFNVEARHAGNIFEPAARFLEIAMNASKSKSEQKLKTLKVRISRQRGADPNDTEQGVIEADPTAFLADRNDLLKDLVGKLRDAKVKKK
jgi:hypothetical protein